MLTLIYNTVKSHFLSDYSPSYQSLYQHHIYTLVFTEHKMRKLPKKECYVEKSTKHSGSIHTKLRFILQWIYIQITSIYEPNVRNRWYETIQRKIIFVFIKRSSIHKHINKNQCFSVTEESISCKWPLDLEVIK